MINRQPTKRRKIFKNKKKKTKQQQQIKTTKIKKTHNCLTALFRFSAAIIFNKWMFLSVNSVV